MGIHRDDVVALCRQVRGDAARRLFQVPGKADDGNGLRIREQLDETLGRRVGAVRRLVEEALEFHESIHEAASLGGFTRSRNRSSSTPSPSRGGSRKRQRDMHGRRGTWQGPAIAQR